MKIQWKKLLLCLFIPLAVGGLSALLSAGGMRDFAAVRQPRLAPPAWLFPVVWTLLYLLMGLAAYLVLTGGNCRQRREAMVVYGAQLAVNFFWSVLFFTFKAYLLAFVWLVLLWGLIVLTVWRFAAVRPLAGWLLVPYLLWVTFAGYLNFGVFLLN